ncbi:MAG: Hsp33 family molecular chaperone HslO [Bdellovibrionales bacterium]
MSSNPTLENTCLPFQLNDAHFRGRLVRLGSVMNDIISRHAYPPIVARMLAETMLLCIALAGALKYEGIFTLQAKGDGAVSSLVADITSGGALRAYAMYDAQRVATEDPGTDATALLLGHGHIAFTVDQGRHAELYQGIVQLSGRTMGDVVANYFRQSEQIATGFVVATDQIGDAWRGGVVMLQKMPGKESAPQEDNAGNLIVSEDDIRRAMMLLGTTTPAELLDDGLPGSDLLNRLFHAEGLEVYEASDIRDECRCSRARVERVLRSLTREEIEDLAENNVVDVTCEFCNRHFTFTPNELHNLDKILTLDTSESQREQVLIRSKGEKDETYH